MQLAVIPEDKANHAIYGYGIAFAAAAVAHYLLRLPLPIARMVGTGVGLAAGVVKEAWDWWSNRQAQQRGRIPLHEVSGGDGLATAAGAIAFWTSTESLGG